MASVGSLRYILDECGISPSSFDTIKQRFKNVDEFEYFLYAFAFDRSGFDTEIRNTLKIQEDVQVAKFILLFEWFFAHVVDENFNWSMLNRISLENFVPFMSLKLAKAISNRQAKIDRMDDSLHDPISVTTTQGNDNHTTTTNETSNNNSLTTLPTSTDRIVQDSNNSSVSSEYDTSKIPPFYTPGHVASISMTNVLQNIGLSAIHIQLIHMFLRPYGLDDIGLFFNLYYNDESGLKETLQILESSSPAFRPLDTYKILSLHRWCINKKPQPNDWINVTKDTFRDFVRSRHLSSNNGEGDSQFIIESSAHIKNVCERVEKTCGIELQNHSTPLPIGCQPEMDQTDFLSSQNQVKYKMLIGAGQSLAKILGRLDILHAVASMARFEAAPRKGHLDLVYQIFGYIYFNGRSAKSSGLIDLKLSGDLIL